MEYVLKSTGEIITGNMVIINGVKHPKQAFNDLDGVIPRKEVPVIDYETQVIEPVSGHEVNGEWVLFAVRNKNAAELHEVQMGKRSIGYGEDGDQLDKLYWDIDAGLFGDAAKTGTFYLSRNAVKSQFPK